MKFIIRRPLCFVCLACLAFAFLVVAFRASGLRAEESRPRPVTAPRYNEQGELQRPTGYRTWVFVGTSIGLQYRPDTAKETTRAKDTYKEAKHGDFHNVYINPEAYEQYVKTGKFPEKTVLVMDVYKAEEREAKDIVSAGLFPGQQLRIEVAVKDSARPDGSKTDWAYYDFPLDQPAAKAFPDSACYQCHLRHASDDNVWVQFYPTLRLHQKAREK